MRVNKIAAMFFMLSLAGCGQDVAPATPDSCSSGQTEEFEGEIYCVYSGPIIETRFTCPEDFPVRHDFDQAIVCTSDGTVPPNFEEPQPWPVDEDGPPVVVEEEEPQLPPCDFGFEASCDDSLTTARSGAFIADLLADTLYWNSPDADLIAAANSGALDTRSGVAAQVARMLDDPKSRQFLHEFWVRYLGIQNLEGGTDIPEFPMGYEFISRPLVLSTVATIHEVTLIDDADVRTIFTTKLVMADDDVAPLLGLSAGPDLERITIPAAEDRAGVLSHPSFMAANSRDLKSMATHRGVSIRNLMCQSVPAPPDDLPLTEAPVEGTSRDKLEALTAQPECAACHSIMDPPAFALEGFDMLGRARTTENGFPINTSGELDGTALMGATDLGEAIASDPRVSSCMVRKLARFSIGTDIGTPLTNEDPYVAALASHWASEGYTLEALMVAILTSDRVLVP